MSIPEIMAVHHLELIGEKHRLITIAIIAYTELMMMWGRRDVIQVMYKCIQGRDKKKRKKNVTKISAKVKPTELFLLWITPQIRIFSSKEAKRKW